MISFLFSLYLWATAAIILTLAAVALFAELKPQGDFFDGADETEARSEPTFDQDQN